MGPTGYLFKPGLLTIVMDGQFGSSGKGKIASFIGEKADNWTFACNAFSAQAGHWVRFGDGRCFFYQHLSSVAYDPSRFEKLYIGPSSCIELPALLREIEENNIGENQLGIAPQAVIIEKSDQLFEQGLAGFDGAALSDSSGTSRFGSTCHGVGSCGARKLLRRPSVVTVDKIDALRPYICDVPNEITERLDRGESGLLELAQGFPLSLNGRFFPYCTSRNVTVAQAMSDMFLATRYAGPVVMNLRTLPIRISSNKYIAIDDGRHLTWDEVQEGVPHTVYEGNSGHWYPDQVELSWEEVTKHSGSPEPLVEMTSVTKLPRRIATFSFENLQEAIRVNDTGKGMFLSLNFANYIDYKLFGCSKPEEIPETFYDWMRSNLRAHADRVMFVGTGPNMEQMVQI